VQDNWAFLYAQKLALEHKLPLHVCFCLVPKFLDATIRHFKFMLTGLEEVAKECESLNIPFHLLRGEAGLQIPDFVKKHNIGGVVCDHSPLRVPKKWTKTVGENLDQSVLFCQIDAHNLVPVWVASDHQEFGPSTLRPKINALLKIYQTKFPPVIKHPYTSKVPSEKIDWTATVDSLEVDRSVDSVEGYRPGTLAAFEMLQSFLDKRLHKYNEKRNVPTDDAMSNLSPWFHFGQIAVQRAIIEVEKYRAQYTKSVSKFCDEAITWRELSDNFAFYNPNYDTLKATSEWAQETLNAHRYDKREYLYTLKEFDDAVTHDDLWNAAQIQMRKEGKMHGFLRMYWSKKILEWSESPEKALEIAIYLNDRYNIDGRDPNGYAGNTFYYYSFFLYSFFYFFIPPGIMWSIAGLHDRPFDERNVYGKIRHMTYAGCKHKFDMKAFISRYGAKAYGKQNK
jgi:deoxyribodipyrimidine photo-lyase